MYQWRVSRDAYACYTPLYRHPSNFSALLATAFAFFLWLCRGQFDTMHQPKADQFLVRKVLGISIVVHLKESSGVHLGTLNPNFCIL